MSGYESEVKSMTEQEMRLVENFIKRAERSGTIEMDAKTIGAVIAMIYDIWKRLYVR